MTKIKAPLPLFDSLENIKKCCPPSYLTSIQQQDFAIAISFLQNYIGSLGTFNSYRRDIERLLHWSWLIENKNIKELKRDSIENFIRFCQKPPKTWIGTKKAPRFIDKNGERIPNAEWRPFVVTVSKAAHRAGDKPVPNNFDISYGSIKELLAILSTFYNFLLQDEYVYMNPVALIRQKSKFIRKNQGQPKIR